MAWQLQFTPICPKKALFGVNFCTMSNFKEPFDGLEVAIYTNLG